LRLHHFFNQPAKHHQPVINVIGPRLPVTYANEIGVIAAGGKYSAGNNRNFMFHRFGAKLKRIHFLVQFKL